MGTIMYLYGMMRCGDKNVWVKVANLDLLSVVATFHRPHPQKEAKLYQVRDARNVLEQAGIIDEHHKL
ncbi:MAG: type II toxin-antitoxin system HicA family toxin [Deinococcales bacterium]